MTSPLRVVIPVAVAVAALLLFKISAPFTRHFESNLAMFGKQARNLSKFGGYIPLTVSGPSLERYDDYRAFHYVEHPPGTAWIVAASFAVFGVAEWSTRLPFAVITVILIFAFWRLSRRVLDERTGLLATVFFALCPMIAYFSGATGHTVPTLLCLVMGLLFYFRWLESGSRRDLAAMYVIQVIGCFCDWPGYYLALFLSAQAALVHRRVWKVALLSVGLNFLVFGIYASLVYLLDTDNHSTLNRLLFAASSRSSSIPIFEYLLGEAREILIYFTVPLVLLSLAWLVSSFRRWAEADRTLLCFLVFGVDEIVFRQLAYHHDYLTYYLAMFFSLAGARALDRLRTSFPAPRMTLVAVLALFSLQSAWILQNRVTREGGYEFYRQLGLALEESSAPDQRILILVDDLSHYTPFYGDRFALRYARAEKVLHFENLGRQIENVEPDDLPRLVAEHSGDFDVAVMARQDQAAEGNEFFRRLGLRFDEPDDRALMKAFNVLPPGSELEKTLERLSRDVVRCRGFLIYTLRSAD